ncbi:MAG: hypothetical protein V1706_00095 [Pseudomonadota bacterium]
MPEKAADTIHFLKTLFNQCGIEAQNILKDDLYANGWPNVDIEKYSVIFTAFNIKPKNVASAAQNIQKNAKIILQGIKKWGNSLSNLEADIRLNNRPEQDAARDALQLKHDCRELSKWIEVLGRQKATLTGATEVISKHLTLTNLLAVANAEADTSRKSNDVFAGGLQVFRLLTDNGELLERDLNIHRLEKKAEKLENALQKMEFPAMPELAKVVLQCHITTCHTALNEIHLYIGTMSRSLVSEMRKVKELEENLGQLHEKSLPETLESLKQYAGRLRRYISEFEYKSQYIKDVVTISILLDNLTVFIEIFRNSYLPRLAEKTGRSGSPLDPYHLAGETGRIYFNGLKGLVRMMKVLFFAGGISGPLNEQTLAEKISIALTSCPYYYCKDEKQTEKIGVFIDSLISGYNKPHPYDALFLLIKNAIEAYGSLIEKDFLHFKTDKKTASQNNTNNSTATTIPGGVQLGRLISKIETRSAQISSLQPQNNILTAKK